MLLQFIEKISKVVLDNNMAKNNISNGKKFMI